MDQWVMGYYLAKDITSYPISMIDWTCLTHIAVARIKANPDGTLNLDFDDGPSGEGAKNAQAVSAAARAHGVKSVLMFGGARQGSDIASAASGHMGTLVDALLAAVEALGYDGLDLDWEDAIDTANLLLLAQKLRTKQPDILLTYPGPTINPNITPDDPDYFADLAALHPYLDKFSIMSYADAPAKVLPDWESWFSSPLSGFATPHPIAIDDNLQRWNTMTKPSTSAFVGIPKEKLMMGIGGYAICYPDGITAPRQSLSTVSTGFIDGGDNEFPLWKMFAKDGPLDNASAARVWDTVAQQPYLSFSTVAPKFVTCGSRPTQYIPYDDEESLIAKGKWSRANGYGGTIVWTLQGMYRPAGAAGTMAPDALVQALKTGFLT
jgi:chitinase